MKKLQLKSPDAIVRVKNNMTGENTCFSYVNPEGKQYQIEGGRTGEMSWKDWVNLQQYEQARKYLSLDPSTFMSEDGELLLYGEDASEMLPLESIHQILALPEQSTLEYLGEMSVGNLKRVREIAQEYNHNEYVEFINNRLSEME